MKILITGGCGYTGTVLSNDLLNSGHEVIVVDSQWFGNFLSKNKKLKNYKIDIRNIEKLSFSGIDTIVHLANIANDPSVELNPNLSWEVNVLATKKIIEKAIKEKVKHFIFASSGSVYGLKKEKKVTEDLSLVPVSIYNKTKMIAERVLKSYEHLIKIHIIRPATVCGYSPRMRLDVTVNMFVYQALKYKKISVFGGQQIRPNINIKDLINVYKHFIYKSNLPSGFYNAGFENLKLINIAKLISKIIPCKIQIKKNIDKRSYRQNSDKLLLTGFVQKYNIEEAIFDLKKRFITNSININQKCYNVKWMNKLNIS
jgi:nucleoside-diphosphate-sugar epimerase